MDTKAEVITTTVETEVFKEETNTESKLIKYPVFLAFAEYFGYVSPFINWVSKLCDGIDIPTFMKHILYTEALSIYHELIKEIGQENLLKLYDEYYELILREYDENVTKIMAKDDLPF